MVEWRVWFTEKKLAGTCIVTGFFNLFVAVRPKFILRQSSELLVSLWISPFSFLGQGTQFFSFSFFFVFIKAVKNKAFFSTTSFPGRDCFFYPAKPAYFAVRTMIRQNVFPPSWTLKLTELGREDGGCDQCTSELSTTIGHFGLALSLCFKARLSAKPSIWNDLLLASK